MCYKKSLLISRLMYAKNIVKLISRHNMQKCTNEQRLLLVLVMSQFSVLPPCSDVSQPYTCHKCPCKHCPWMYVTAYKTQV